MGGVALVGGCIRCCPCNGDDVQEKKLLKERRVFWVIGQGVESTIT